MTRIQLVLLAASMASFVATIAIGRSIAEDVNEELGTDYKGVFVRNGNPWNEHERLFPGSRKRLTLAATLIASIGFLMLDAALKS